MSMIFNTKVIETKGESKFVTGTGTAGTAGSATVAYKPSLWTFDMGMTPTAGDMVTIKIPVAGNTSGVWMSVDNGTNYYPIAVSGNGRLTTHFPNGYVITLIYETGFVTKLYGNTKTGGAAGASLTEYTLDRWRIHNYYDSGNTNNAVTQTATTTNAAYEVLFSATADNTTRTEGARKTSTLTYNPSTKVLTTGGAVNGLTLTAAGTGFTIAGGTTSKTLTVSETYTLAAACAKGVTDRTSSTAASSSGTNLITERTLYYALENAGSRVAITNTEIDALFT